jgi:3-hydroxyacyl-[acyl-carrier-protein] dehydratase
MTEYKKIIKINSPEVTEDCAVGTYTVSGSEDFLRGHFPQFAVVPGVVLCEMMAQVAGGLAEAVGGGSSRLRGMDKVRFKNPVVPGDTVLLKAKIIKKEEDIYTVKGEGYVGQTLCVAGEISLAME